MDSLSLSYCILLFFIYSLAGWLIEVTLKYFQYGRFINRGFLIGPYCPIYGGGALLVTIFSYLLRDYDTSYGTTFLISFVSCGLLEYFASLFSEYRFHARWWDYSQKPMNLHGRVWIGNLILFGLGGTLIAKVLNPYLFLYFESLSPSTVRIFAGLVLLIMVPDYILSHFIVKLLKEGIEQSQSDQSEHIAQEVRAILANKSALHRRIIDAYPELTIRTEKVKARLKKIREESDRIRNLAGDRIDLLSDQLEEAHGNLAKNLMTSRDLQKTIIALQDDLIADLLSESADEAEKEALIKEIWRQKALLREKEERGLLSLLANRGSDL